MFLILWGFPLVLVRWTGDNGFLWFFIVSLIVSVGVFSHYEDLEKIDNRNSDNYEPNE